MKLTIIALVLGLTGIASADGPPGYDQGPRPGLRAERRAERLEMKRLIIERFDRNGDGRLEPGERRHAIRALRKMARQLARQDRGDKRMARVIRKYDLNHDGNVDAGEMPPAVADKLRKLDRNGDGWVDPAEMER
jgi:hypothetical protein